MPCLLLFASALRSSHSNLNDIAQLIRANTISRPARSFAATASVISVSTIANQVVRRKLRVDVERAQAWSDTEVLRRWTKLYTGPEMAAIPFAFDDYLELVDTPGRVIREDKRGYIPGETPQILERLNIDPEQFITTAARMLDLFRACEHWDIRFA